MKKPFGHNIEYKGYLITCINGVYRVPEISWRRVYFSFNAAKAVIDKLEEPENFVKFKR